MKRFNAILPLRAIALTLAAAGLAASAGAFARSEPPARIQVTWAPAEQLTEVKNNRLERGWMRPKDWQQSLADDLRVHADRLLPPDEQLQVTFEDIKLAGDFEPWHRPGLDDVRVLKDIYPPRAQLHYRLLAGDGRVLREGDAKLADLSYLQRAVPDTTDALRYDKRMLREWLRREFGRVS